MINDGVWPNMNVERRYRAETVTSIRYWTQVRYQSGDDTWRLKRVDLQRDLGDRQMNGGIDEDTVLQEFVVLVHKTMVNFNNLTSPEDKSQEDEFKRIDRLYGYR